jgi:hypothetical protein
MFTVAYTYTDETGCTVTITDYFRNEENASAHAQYIRQHHNVTATIS